MDDEFKLQRRMNSALDQDLSAEEIEALHAQIEEAPQAAQRWNRLQQVDKLLHETPLVAPLPGFASRVMAAIAAMPLPDFAARRTGLGLALGLLVGALFALPLLSLALILLVSVLTSPSTLNAVLQTATNAGGYAVALGRDAGEQINTLATRTPLVPVLISTVIPLTMVWAWWVWTLWRDPELASERSVL